MINIKGDCSSVFLKVKDVFSENFNSADEVGAAVSLYYKGKKIIDLWGGMANAKEQKPWQENTLVNVFSATKGVTAICAHRLVEDGKLDLEKSVAYYWPEFAQKGKEKIPVNYLLNHKAGLPAIRTMLPNEALYEWDTMTAALAAEEPWWTPGEKHGYHAITYGWLVGEVIRRVSGLSVGAYFKKTFADPLELDFFIGLPEAEHGRVARLQQPRESGTSPESAAFMQAVMSDPMGITARSFANPFSITTDSNKPEWRSSEIPSANGHGSARALARLYGALAVGGELDGVHLLNEESIRRCYLQQSCGLDEVLKCNTRFASGFMLSQENVTGGQFGPGDRTFGHPGAGGSVAFADPDAEIGFAYVMNRMGPHIFVDPRAVALIDAVYACL